MPTYPIDGLEPEIPEPDEVWIAPTAVVIGRVRLKPLSSVWFGSVLRADDDSIEIGERTNIQDNCVLHVDPGYPIKIGDDCTIGHKVMLHGCTIDSNSLIGMNSTILNGARIGRNCLIGAHTLIPEGRIIPDDSVVLGAPGKVVRTLDASGIAFVAEAASLYVTKWRRYKRGFGS